jgi:nucleotide-binding universal stress UspA family protein
LICIFRINSKHGLSEKGVKVMAFKTLLCVVAAHHSNLDLKICMTLTREVDGHCSVLVLSEAPTLPAGFYGDVIPTAWYEERKKDAEKLQKRADAIELIVKDAGVSADVTTEYVEQNALAEVVGHHARYSDLVVLGPTLLKDKYIGPATIDGAIFNSGRPFLLVPQGSTPTLCPQNIMVASDGSMEAMRAARDAVDLVRGAKDVRIALVDPHPNEVGQEPGCDEAAYLARHGAKVTVDRLPSSGASVADTLARHAKDQSADLLVMGAYGHSRLRERLFGGVTKSILATPPIPVLMAH